MEVEIPNEKIDQLIDVLEKQEIEVSYFKVMLCGESKQIYLIEIYFRLHRLCPLNCMLNCLLLTCTETSCEWVVFLVIVHFFIIFFRRSKARYLWQRIPASVKAGNVELEKIWNIFNHLWENDGNAFFKSIDFEWSSNVAKLMSQLKGN